eukprot:964572_1
MSTAKLNFHQHLNSVTAISKQYCDVMRHLDSELSTAKTRITSLEAKKNKMSEHTQQISQLLNGQSKLIQRIVALESRYDGVIIEGNDDHKSTQLSPNACDPPNNITEEKQISFPAKTTRNKPVPNSVALHMECMKLPFIRVMKQFNKTNHYDEEIDIKQTLNEYLYAMDTYNDDYHFEAIAREMGVCDATKCKIFERHYRDRNTVDICDARRQIMDTIHCYYQHCYDIGNRLSLQEQMLCDNSGDNAENVFINHKIRTIRKILQNKHKYPVNGRRRYNTPCKPIVLRNKGLRLGHKENLGAVGRRNNTEQKQHDVRYEQLSSFANQNQCGQCGRSKTGEIDKTNGVFYCYSCWKKYDNMRDETTSDETHENDSDMFHFGVKFEYNKADNGFSYYDKNKNVYKICRKYKSLKDEMLNNAVLTLNHNAFKQELSKA